LEYGITGMKYSIPQLIKLNYNDMIYNNTNLTKKPFVFIIVLFVSLISNRSYAQTSKTDSANYDNALKFKYQSLIIPTILIGYGVIGIESDGLKDINNEVKEEVNEHIDDKFTIDDISQHLPALSVYALNAMGIKGKNNFKDRTIILATSYILMASTVTTLKYTTKIRRPDNSSYNSFPSGHTATAFVGAEFLWQEYKDVSIWYGISGYAVAAGTGIFRIVNDRHWITDVAAGAGIGMLSTKIAYWINPWMTRRLFKKSNPEHKSSVMLPYYNGKQIGVALSLRF